MKIAYLILAHKNPQQILRLVSRLNTDDTTFIIHIDKKTIPEVFREISLSLEDYPNVYFTKKRHKIYYGHISLVYETLECLRELYKRHILFDYVICLSGQHYPIKSNEQIQHFLQKNNGLSFIEHCWHLRGLNLEQNLARTASLYRGR